MLMVYCMILWYCTACLILKMLLPFYCLDCGGQKIWIFVFMCINYNLAIWKEMFSRKLESPKWNYIYIYSKYNIVESKTILSQLNKAWIKLQLQCIQNMGTKNGCNSSPCLISNVNKLSQYFHLRVGQI